MTPSSPPDKMNGSFLFQWITLTSLSWASSKVSIQALEGTARTSQIRMDLSTEHDANTCQEMRENQVLLMNEWVNEWENKWMSKGVREWMNEWMNLSNKMKLKNNNYISNKNGAMCNHIHKIIICNIYILLRHSLLSLSKVSSKSSIFNMLTSVECRSWIEKEEGGGWREKKICSTQRNT